jgi:hypothetical protein
MSYHPYEPMSNQDNPVFSQPVWPIPCRVHEEKGNPMIGQAFSVYHRRIFGLPMEEYSYIMLIIKTFSLFTGAMKDKPLRGRL